MTVPAPATLSHVIVVDGDADCVGATAAALCSAGFRVTCVANALAAMRAVLAMRPDAIVLEQALPDFTGLELARAIRSLAGCAHIPLVFVAHGDLPRRDDAGSLAFTALRKPVRAEALVTAVRDALAATPPDDVGYSISRRLG